MGERVGRADRLASWWLQARARDNVGGGACVCVCVQGAHRFETMVFVATCGTREPWHVSTRGCRNRVLHSLYSEKRGWSARLHESRGYVQAWKRARCCQARPSNSVLSLTLFLAPTIRTAGFHPRARPFRLPTKIILFLPRDESSRFLIIHDGIFLFFFFFSFFFGYNWRMLL